MPLLDEGKQDEPKADEADEPDEAAVIAAVKAALGERVSDVRASQRLDRQRRLPGRGEGGAGPRTRAAARAPEPRRRRKPILELNMRHALVQALGAAHKASHESDVNDLAALLFEQAQILDGEVPDDPAAFAARLNRLVVRGLGGQGRVDPAG